MLLELSVQNLLLIERARLPLSPGLNVLTGETGAGKTVLAHALDLLLGGRARAGIVRPGASEAYVEGVFALSDAAREQLEGVIAPDCEELVLARRVGADGRTRAYLDGRSVSVAELRETGARLVSFYGQHEHRKLTLAGAQLQMLDAVCGAAQAEGLRACATAHGEVLALEAELERLRELDGARERELDLLEHELDEIDAGAPEESEHERLLGVRERLRRLDALVGAAAAGVQALEPEGAQELGAGALLAGAAAQLEAVQGVDERLDQLGERLGALSLDARELAGELRDYGEGLGAEDCSLEEVEGRLSATERLIRKHGGSIAAVHEYAGRARARRAELAAVEVELTRTEERLAGARAEREGRVAELRAARERAAPALAAAVREQLAALGMAEAGFEIALTPCSAGPHGGDRVEFLLAPNPGVPAAPLRETASGGELSRAMLAVIAAGAEDGAGDTQEQADRPTIVFDEIDAGIGGHAARAVGERLRRLGRSRQLLCITHLPQIASLGARHFAVVKDTSADPTRASVLQLDEPDVVTELVRMLGAAEGDTAARRHARDLRRAA